VVRRHKNHRLVRLRIFHSLPDGYQRIGGAASPYHRFFGLLLRGKRRRDVLQRLRKSTRYIGGWFSVTAQNWFDFKSALNPSGGYVLPRSK